MDNLSYFCFSTPRNKYMYVRNINSIIRISEKEYKELIEARKNDREYEVINKYKKLGVFVDNPVKLIEHPNTEIIEYLAKYHCKQLTLQVTQQCNLRCEYCAYSGMYENRVHSNKKMTFETAKKAIDFFIEHSRETKQLSFGFYGGEPLLMFPLIKQCMEYIEDSIEGKEILYSITTNGTLLNDEIVDFFAEHNVFLSISLDGAKKDHDRHRKFVSGEGSFDLIMNNIERLKKRYPQYGETIMFLPVITPNANLERVLRYFETNKVTRGNLVLLNPVSTTGMKKELEKKEEYNKEEFELTSEFEYFKLLLALAGMLEQKTVSSLVNRSITDHENFYDRISRHDLLGEITHHGGPCVPGVAKLFVTTDGEFYSCEKVSENNPQFCIGNIAEGFDIGKMKALLNIGTITADECKECWNLPNCSICMAKLEPGKKCFDKETKLALCKEEKNGFANYIYEMAVLSEFSNFVEWNGVKIYG